MTLYLFFFFFIENTLAELPHFSNSFLSDRYAIDVKLSYDYYLQQARPMYAYLVYVKNHSDRDKERCVTFFLYYFRNMKIVFFFQSVHRTQDHLFERATHFFNHQSRF